MGADAHEYIGVWDLPLRPRIYTAFSSLLTLRDLAQSDATHKMRDLVSRLGEYSHRGVKVGSWRHQLTLIELSPGPLRQPVTRILSNFAETTFHSYRFQLSPISTKACAR